MIYLSPFQLLGIRPGETPDPAKIKRTRKRWLARFEQEEATTLPVQGGQVDRSEILTALDAFSDPQLLEFHTRIWQNAGLRQFLLEGNAQVLLKTRLDREKSPIEYLEFVRPYLRDAIYQASQKSLNSGKYRDAVVLAASHPLLLEEDWEKAYQPFQHFYRDIYEQLPLLKPGSKEFRVWIHKLGNRVLMKAFRSLPPTFDQLLVNFGKFMLSFSKHLLRQQGQFVGEAAIMIAAGLELKASPEVNNALLNSRAALSRTLDKNWSAFVDDAILKNQEALTDTRHRGIDWEKQWKKVVGLGVLVLATLILFFYFLSNPGPSTWDPGNTMPKWAKGRTFGTYNEYRETREKAKEVKDLLEGPKVIRLLNEYAQYTQNAPEMEVDILDRPLTGAAPFESLVKNGSYQVDMEWVRFHNRSEQDVVFFVMNEERIAEISHHVFVRAGKSRWMNSLVEGSYYFLPYAGNNWNKIAIATNPKAKRKEQKRIGAFEKGTQPMFWRGNQVPEAHFFTISPRGEEFVLLDATWDGEAISWERTTISENRLQQIVDEEDAQTKAEKEEKRGIYEERNPVEEAENEPPA